VIGAACMGRRLPKRSRGEGGWRLAFRVARTHGEGRMPLVDPVRVVHPAGDGYTR
jgi:hypothetical protein